MTPIAPVLHALPSTGLRFAEAVLPGHPDKLSDQVADALVDLALHVDDRAIVQVEVAVHDHRCHVNGRISTAGTPLDRALVEATVRVARSLQMGTVAEGIETPGQAALLQTLQGNTWTTSARTRRTWRWTSPA